MKMPNARRSRRSLMLACLIGSALVLAPSCAGRDRIKSPPAADLAPEPEPQLDAEAVIGNDSAAALDDYDIEHASWGRRGWDQVARLCWWFKDVGVATPDCGPRPAAEPVR